MHPTKITFKNLTAASLAWQLMLKECNVRKSAAHSRAAIARCKSILDHYLLQICLSNAVARPQLQKPSALILRFSNPSHLVWCMAQCFTTMLQTFARHDQRRCWGRWNLMAQKIYRCDSLCVCMWVAEHVFPHISRVVQLSSRVPLSRGTRTEIDWRLPKSHIASQLMGAQRQGCQERRRDVSWCDVMYLLYFQIHFLRPAMYICQIMWYGPGYYIVLLHTTTVLDVDLDYTMSLSMYLWSAIQWPCSPNLPYEHSRDHQGIRTLSPLRFLFPLPLVLVPRGL